MLNKELRDALKQFLECLLPLLIIPVAFVFDKYVIHSNWRIADIFNYAFLVVLVIYPLMAGTLIFQSEKKDNAFEYLLSLPLSRPKILADKIGPRLLFLFVLLLAALAISPFKDVLMNGFNLLVLFLISLFLCLSYTSIVVYFLEIGLLFWLFYLDSQILNYLLWRPEISRNIFPNIQSQLLAAALLLVPLGLAFLLTFKRFDVKPLKFQMKSYVFIALPAVLALITLTVVFVKKYWAWSHTG